MRNKKIAALPGKKSGKDKDKKRIEGSKVHKVNGTPKFSLFKGTGKKKIADISCEEYFQGIKDGKWKKEVDYVRSAKHKITQDARKKSTPSVTPSAVLKTRDKRVPLSDKLVTHSGLICFDIDLKDNPDLDVTKVIDTDCLAQHVSIRGNGLKIFYWCDKTEDRHAHGRMFEAGKKRLAALGVIVDQSCKDICRLQFVSYDPDLYYHPGSQVFLKPGPAPKIKPYKPSKDTSKEVRRLVKFITDIRKNDPDFDPTLDRDDWIAITMGCANSGEEFREVYHLICRKYPRYDVQECNEKFNEFLS